MPGILAADVRDDPSVLDERRTGSAEVAFRARRTGAWCPRSRSSFRLRDRRRGVAPRRRNVYTAPLATTGTARGPSSKPKSSRYDVGYAYLPLRLAAGGIDRFDDLAIRDAMEEDDAILNDDRPAESLTDRPAPDDAWAGSPPCFTQWGSAVDAVAAGTEDLRPVRRDRLRSKCERRAPPIRGGGVALEKCGLCYRALASAEHAGRSTERSSCAHASNRSQWPRTTCGQVYLFNHIAGPKVRCMLNVVGTGVNPEGNPTF